MSGDKLISQMASLTGLPQESAQKELLKIIADYGLDPKELSLQDLRTLLANYLQDVLIEAKHEYSKNFEAS